MSGFVNISAAQPMRKPKKKRKHNEKKKTGERDLGVNVRNIHTGSDVKGIRGR
jgi:hypothetical protein